MATSEARKRAQKRYLETEGGKLAAKRANDKYNASDKGHERKQRYFDTPDGHRAKLDATHAYEKRHIRQFLIKANDNTEMDIIEWLDNQTSKQGAIKQLIRENIARTGGAAI